MSPLADMIGRKGARVEGEQQVTVSGSAQRAAAGVTDYRVWIKASASSPAENKSFLVEFASAALHYQDRQGSGPRLVQRVVDWMNAPTQRCEVNEVLERTRLGVMVGEKFAALVQQGGMAVRIYSVPSSRSADVVLRVVFPERPTIDKRVAVFDAIGDVMDDYPDLSIDLMTLDPEEIAACPLPADAVEVSGEES